MKSKTTKQEELREELMDILIECHGIDQKEASCIVDGSLLSLLHQQKKELLEKIEEWIIKQDSKLLEHGKSPTTVRGFIDDLLSFLKQQHED